MRIGLDKDYHGDIHDGDDKDDDEDDNNDQAQQEGSAVLDQSVHKDKESVDKENNSHIDDDKDDDHDELSTLQSRSSIKSFRKDDNSVDNDYNDVNDDVDNDDDHVKDDVDDDHDDDESGMKANRTKLLPRKEVLSIVPTVNLASTSIDSDESSSLSLGGTLNNNTWAITNKEEVYDVIALVCTPQKMDKSMV
jgi:hypothetical protein